MRVITLGAVRGHLVFGKGVAVVVLALTHLEIGVEGVRAVHNPNLMV